jgi:hypothetical protein
MSKCAQYVFPKLWIHIDRKAIGEVDVVLPKHREPHYSRTVVQRHTVWLEKQADVAVVAQSSSPKG